jgi:acetyl esterase/lipase
VAVTITYRLISSMSAPDVRDQLLNCIFDTKSAIRWIKLHADVFGIDTGKVILGGGSAGGYLATMAALDGQLNDGEDTVTVSTRAVAMVLFNPAYYPDTLTPDVRQIPQPYPLINAGTPPSIEFFGDKDSWMTNGVKFHAALKAAGRSTELWIAPGETHAFFNKGKWYQSVLAQTDLFLVSLGLLQGKGISGPANAVLVPSVF